MPKIQKTMKSDFTMVHNAFLKDRRLNSSARGVLMTMLSKPNDYKFTIRGLANEMSDGVTSVSSSLNRIEKFGYLKRERQYIKGKFSDMIYYYSDEPIFETEFNDPKKDNPNYRPDSDTKSSHTEKPNTENPNTEEPKTENSNDLISTDILRTERIRTKENKKEKPQASKPDKKKKQYAEAVYMTETEYQTLCEKHSKKFADRCIEVLNNYKLSKGKFYRSDYHAILSWVEKKVLEDIAKSNGNNNQPLSVSMPVKTDPNENPFTKFLNESGGA